MKKYYGFILLTIFMLFCSCGEKEVEFDYSILSEFYFKVERKDISIIGVKDKEVEEIKIPEGVTKIETSAIYSCDNLKRVYIPSTVDYINPKCYWSCELLEEFVIDENNERYKSIDGNIYSKDGTEFIRYMMGKKEENVTITGVKEIGDYAFWNIDSIKSISIGEGVEKIGIQSFCSCPFLENILLPESMVEIHDQAFVGTWIKEINIHKNVSKIGKEVFRNCKKLENINVSGDNPYYCDVDGVLFNKDVTELYAYTYGKMIDVYQVPDTVKEIKDHAFSLEGFFEFDIDVIIPKTTKTIGETIYDSYGHYYYITFFYLGDYKDMYFSDLKLDNIFIFCYSETDIACWSFDENGKPMVHYKEDE